MVDSLRNQNSEAKAFCLGNIIIINFTIFKNYDFKLYDRLNNRIDYILDRLEEDDDQPKPKWYKNLMEVNEKIEIKKKEVEDELNKINEKNKIAINEINKIFDSKIKNNKPIEFIDFILDKYPFINYDPSKKEKIKNNNLENLLKEISPNYHPDNYKDRNDYIIYHEIYMLLVNIENKFIKND